MTPLTPQLSQVILGGTDETKNVHRVMMHCRAVILLLTKNVLLTAHCLHEVGEALRIGCPVVTIYLLVFGRPCSQL